MKYHIHRIHIWPVVRIAFVFFLLLGLFAGILYLFMMGLLANFMAYTGDRAFASEFFRLSGFAGILGILILSVIQSVLCSGLIAVLLLIYNLFGGISMEIDITSPEDANVQYASLPDQPGDDLSLTQETGM